MNQSTRDRSLPLSLPKVGRAQPRYCAFCGATVPANAERYGRCAYCNSDCHKAGRKANAAENRKRKQLRTPQVIDATARQTAARCWKCKRKVADDPDAFLTDVSRKSGKANICKSCESAKTAEYYRREQERIKAKSKARNRTSRASSYPSVPQGVDLTPRQCARASANLASLLAELPEDAPGVLLNALSAGKINGAVFEDKSGCGCLWGTLGRAYSWSIAEEGEWAKRFRQRWSAEIDLFGHITPGDNPATNPYARVIVETILRWTVTRK